MLLATHEYLSLESGCKISRVKFGRHVRIGANAAIADSCLGDYTYIGPQSSLTHTTVGKFCSIAPQVNIGTGSHPARTFVSSHPALYLSRPGIGWSLANHDYHTEFAQTIIGNDVWIGVGATILDGLQIGDGAIVGAGAVVVKDIEPYTIWGGVPAKLIRRRFSDDEIEYLLGFRWWDRDDDWLRSNLEALHDIKLFTSISRQSMSLP